MEDTVTREEAEAVLALVKSKFSAWLHTWPVINGRMDFDACLVPVPESEQPQLVQDYQGTGHWAIVWESGSPYEWALTPIDEPHQDGELRQLARDAGAHGPGAYTVQPPKDRVPEGVYAEADMSFVLVLYKEV